MKTTKILAHKKFQKGKIDPRIYGSFVEHMGRVVYSGIYEPAMRRRMRTDSGRVAQAMHKGRDYRGAIRAAILYRTMTGEMVWVR